MHTIYIKNMVCPRCIMVVKRELDKLNISLIKIQLGEVVLSEPMPQEAMRQLAENIYKWGFEVLDDKKSLIVEKVKNIVVNLVHGGQEENIKLSVLLAERLNLDYHYISKLFSTTEGTTIEKYAILQKIERIKELMMYEEKSLSEIAFELGYSSVQHLSQQFKKVTGLTPSHFKQLKENKRKPLDRII